MRGDTWGRNRESASTYSFYFLLSILFYFPLFPSSPSYTADFPLFSPLPFLTYSLRFSYLFFSFLNFHSIFTFSLVLTPPFTFLFILWSSFPSFLSLLSFPLSPRFAILVSGKSSLVIFNYFILNYFYVLNTIYSFFSFIYLSFPLYFRQMVD